MALMCPTCGARGGEKCDPNGHMQPPAAEAIDETPSIPQPPRWDECVEHARSNLMRAEALIAEGGGALADVHANVAAGWGTLAVVLAGPVPPTEPDDPPGYRPALRMRRIGGES